MSYDNDTSHQIWVSDLDDHINLDGIFAEHEALREEELLNDEIARIGDIALFGERTISFENLNLRGISPKIWRWMLHEAEASLCNAKSSSEVEAAYVRAVIASGRRYAVARYARLEHLPFPSAITATFPHGIRALLYQYMAGETLLASMPRKAFVYKTLQEASKNRDLMAYDQTGLVRQRLHQLAIASGGMDSHLSLSKEGMRNVLSLCRLYFSAIECNISSVSELLNLNARYDLARKVTERKFDQSHVVTGTYVANWKARHLRPLIYYFPYSARNALTRVTLQSKVHSKPISRTVAANELALVQCGRYLMRKLAKEKSAVAAQENKGEVL